MSSTATLIRQANVNAHQAENHQRFAKTRWLLAGMDYEDAAAESTGKPRTQSVLNTNAVHAFMKAREWTMAIELIDSWEPHYKTTRRLFAELRAKCEAKISETT